MFTYQIVHKTSSTMHYCNNAHTLCRLNLLSQVYTTTIYTLTYIQISIQISMTLLMQLLSNAWQQNYAYNVFYQITCSLYTMVFPKDKLSVIVTSYIKKDGLELRSQEKFLQRKFPKKYSIWIIRFRTFCRNLSMTDDKNRLQNCKMLGLDHITRLNSTQLNSTGQFSDHSASGAVVTELASWLEWSHRLTNSTQLASSVTTASHTLYAGSGIVIMALRTALNANGTRRSVKLQISA